MGPHQSSNLLCSKGQEHSSKVEAYRMGEKSLPNYTSARGLISRKKNKGKQNITKTIQFFKWGISRELSKAETKNTLNS